MSTGALDRARHHDRLAQVELVDLEGDALFGPQAQEDVQVALEDAAALLERHAHGVELARVPARRHAQDEAPARDHVQAAQGLGGDHGIAEGQHEHARAELDLAGPRRHGAEGGDRVDDGEGGLDAQEDVVPGPQRLEAERLGALGVGVEARDIRDLAGTDEIADGQTEVGHGNLLSL